MMRKQSLTLSPSLFLPPFFFNWASSLPVARNPFLTSLVLLACSILRWIPGEAEQRMQSRNWDVSQPVVGRQIVMPKFYKHSPLHICTVSYWTFEPSTYQSFPPLLLICQSFLLSCYYIFLHLPSLLFIFSHPLTHLPPVCLFLPLSEIPALSLCPPDSECATEAQLTVIQSEGELCDSCSSLGRPSSSCQLYHQVCLSGLCCLSSRINVYGSIKTASLSRNVRK